MAAARSYLGTPLRRSNDLGHSANTPLSLLTQTTLSRVQHAVKWPHDQRRGDRRKCELQGFEGRGAGSPRRPGPSRRGDFVANHVELSLFPNWSGVDRERLVEVTGNRLTLRTRPLLLNGIEQRARHVWERV